MPPVAGASAPPDATNPIPLPPARIIPSPRTRGWSVPPPPQPVARALRAVFEDAPRAQYRSAVVLASLVVPFAALIALRGGAAARPLPFALSLLVGLVAFAWIVRQRVLTERAWAVMAPVSAVGFALGAAAMQHDRDLLLALLVVPVAYFGVYMRSSLVGLALLCYGVAAATPIALADTGAHGFTSFGARLLGIVVTAAVTHGLAMSLREARGTGTRIAESLDDSLYTLEQTPGGPVNLHFLGGRERAERLLGGPLPEGTTLGEIWTAALHPEDLAAYDEADQALLAGEPRDLEYRLTGVDGRVRWIWDRGWPQLLRDGRLMVDGIVTDVTERRRMDSELAEARENLDRIVESIDESLYTLVGDEDGGWSCLYAGPGWELILGGPLPGGRRAPPGLARAGPPRRPRALRARRPAPARGPPDRGPVPGARLRRGRPLAPAPGQAAPAARRPPGRRRHLHRHQHPAPRRRAPAGRAGPGRVARRRARPRRPDRRPHRRREPPAPAAGARRRAGARKTAAGPACWCSTSTTSSGSTTASATSSATRCWSRWPTGCAAPPAAATSWPGSAARSSASWCATSRTSASCATWPSAFGSRSPARRSSPRPAGSR